MPLKLNVGLSKKIGEANYGSRGASVNVEMELEAALVADSDKFKERIRQLFASIRASLFEELNGKSAATAGPSTGQYGNGQPNGSGHPATSGPTQPQVRPATQSQIKALYAIARSQRLDLAQFVRDRFRLERPEDLSLKEASGAIDDLKRKE
jgi:hypothetical protein